MRDMRDFVHDGLALLAPPPTRQSLFAHAVKQAWGWVTAPVRAFFQRDVRDA